MRIMFLLISYKFLLILQFIILNLIPFKIYCWNERDEAKRIAQIKDEERRMYEMQIGQKLPASPYKTSTSFEEVQADYSELPSSQKRVFSAQATEMAFPLYSSQGQSIISTTPINLTKNWCFHCASPLNVLNDDMQKVVRNFLDIRRAQYPFAGAITNDCVHPRDLDKMPREICQGYSHCQTLVLTDHNAGTAFTIRGCAEHFGAVDPEVLAKRVENSCKKITDRVDIKECICKDRKYCYTGPERRWTTKYTPLEEWKGPIISSTAAAWKNNGFAAKFSNRIFTFIIFTFFLVYSEIK